MNQGKCYICGGMYSDKGIARHIRTCIADKCGINATNDNIPKQGTYLIKVQDRYQKEYYLYLLVDGCVLLSELDRYLRDIWLECCGHLSCFKIEGDEYDSHPDTAWNDEEGMDIEVGDVIDIGLSFSYTYDFGSSTMLGLKVMDVYQPIYEEKGIRLAGRNLMVKYPCSSCDREAVSMFENHEDGKQGLVCRNCMDRMKSENEEIYFSDPVNSPRSGVCGYDGSAKDILFMKHKKIKKQQKIKKLVMADSRLPFMDKLLSGEMTKADAKVDFEEILSRMMNMVEHDTYSQPPFIIDKKKLKGETLRDCLNQLRKSELDTIRKYHNIENVSSLKKDALVALLSDYLINDLEDIIAYMPILEYSELIDLMETENAFCESSEEISEDLEDLRNMGIIFSVDDGNGEIEWIIPRDIVAGIEALAASTTFFEKRELSARIEHTIIGIFFYWGIVRKCDLINGISRLLDVPLDHTFAGNIDKVFGYMTNSYIEKERIGSGEYFFMFTEEPAQKVVSDSWQKAGYPEITREMMAFAEEGWMGCVLQNPYFKLMYDSMTEMEESEEDEDFNQDTILDSVSLIADYVLNARPGTTVGQMAEKLELAQDLKKASEIRELFKNMLMYSPNYWIKGNAISGSVHVIKNNDELKGPGKTSLENRGKAAEKAAVKWKVGRNDPCPCGSGKKYKKCCM